MYISPTNPCVRGGGGGGAALAVWAARMVIPALKNRFFSYYLRMFNGAAAQRRSAGPAGSRGCIHPPPLGFHPP